MQFTAKQIAKKLKGSIEGDENALIWKPCRIEEVDEGVWNRFSRGVKDAWSGYRQGYAMQRRIEHIRKLIPEVEKNVDQMSSLINELPSDDYTTAMQKYISSIQYSIKGLNDMCAHLSASRLYYQNPNGQYQAQEYGDYMNQNGGYYAQTRPMQPNRNYYNPANAASQVNY